MKRILYTIAAVSFLLNPLKLNSEELSFGVNNYFIKEKYISRTEYCHYDDRGDTGTCQEEVYLLAHRIISENNFSKIVDVGCGSAFKLMKYFGGIETVGYEIEPTLQYLKDQYPKRSWKLSDLQRLPNDENIDVVICADVIEHLVNPDQLLNFINRFDFKYLVISTPDRNHLLKFQGSRQSQTGPPVNLAHIREWSYEEFEAYVSQYFNIVSHINTKKEYWGQVIVATKKSN
jgi:trans-aconitate methyltransferase